VLIILPPQAYATSTAAINPRCDRICSASARPIECLLQCCADQGALLFGESQAAATSSKQIGTVPVRPHQAAVAMAPMRKKQMPELVRDGSAARNGDVPAAGCPER
jgi:hypothetical protein